MKRRLVVTKASGDKAIFSEEKLRRSLARSGATAAQVNDVIEAIIPKLYENITTKKIYHMAFNMLKEDSRHLAAKYHLKQAIMELGPSGYPFEKFVGEILKHQGYKVKIGEVVQGRCVQHEIDVIARKESKQLMIECKYHNLPGIFCDVKIPLYIQSRFKDVEATWLGSGDAKMQYQGWLYTNTRFSFDAIQYGTCAGLKLTGWDYPLKGGLKDQIDALGLYPVTCLTSLNRSEKQWLLSKGIVLCLELYNNESLLEQAGVRSSRIDVVMQETHQLCKNIIDQQKKNERTV